MRFSRGFEGTTPIRHPELVSGSISHFALVQLLGNEVEAGSPAGKISALFRAMDPETSSG
jgi:hypothetical protein